MDKHLKKVVGIISKAINKQEDYLIDDYDVNYDEYLVIGTHKDYYHAIQIVFEDGVIGIYSNFDKKDLTSYNDRFHLLKIYETTNKKIATFLKSPDIEIKTIGLNLLIKQIFKENDEKKTKFFHKNISKEYSKKRTTNYRFK